MDNSAAFQSTAPPIAPSRHCWKVYDLCSHPAIVKRMAGIYGPDLILWRSNFFEKKPGDKEIPWHQDRHYWPIQPFINITAWVAIDQATLENSCVQLIPGSHNEFVPHISAPAEMAFAKMADPSYISNRTVVDMVSQPGEFFLFNEQTLHRSAPNHSNQRRLGLAIRVTIPIVRVDHSKLFKGHKVIVISGEDRLGFNEITSPPK